MSQTTSLSFGWRRPVPTALSVIFGTSLVSQYVRAGAPEPWELLALPALARTVALATGITIALWVLHSRYRAPNRAYAVFSSVLVAAGAAVQAGFDGELLSGVVLFMGVVVASVFLYRSLDDTFVAR